MPLTIKAQNIEKGQVITERILSKAISGNPGGEDPLRRVTIYLPPGYDESDERYPVLYYLHGFTWSDSLTFSRNKMHDLLDKAIYNGLVRKLIVVVPNQYTLFRGSFLTNSDLTGNWVDFTVSELVDYIDQNYRSIPQRESRGLAGHSMGGNGALKIGMLRPEVISALYALSPAVLDWSDEFSLNNPSLQFADSVTTREELFTDFYANAFIAMCRAYAPNLDNEPFQCDLPASFSNNEMTINHEVLAKWDRQLPTNMIPDHIEALQSMTAIKIDWGRNEQFRDILINALKFSKELESLGIDHYAEEYIGTHGNKLWTLDGRFYNDLLPFFNAYLRFE